MAYKAFAENEINPRPFVEEQTISISEDSPCASHIHLLTGVRSLGKINVFKSGTAPAFNEVDPKEIKYKWNFDNQVLAGQSLTANITTGVFLSSSDQTYKSSTNDNSFISSQSLFRYAQGYLYRPDSDYVSTTALVSSSSADTKISVLRQINVRKDIYHSSFKSAAFKIQINDSNTSLTAAVDGASANAGYNTIAAGVFGSETPNVSGYVTALDLKNPFGGESGLGRKSFFGVGVSAALGNIYDTRNGQGYTAGNNLDSIKGACTIEAIIRPMKSDSIIYFRRLASSGATITRNKFMKMELTRSADNREPAFRFYIRDAATEASFSEDFAQPNVQASGLFVPADVGINLFDGDFHHLVVSWDHSEIVNTGNNASADRGAGVVMGYIDGYKLQNKEQVFPRLPGADAAGGPAIQANMIDQRIPIRQVPLWGTVGTASAPNNDPPAFNNVYVGASNYNRDNGIRTGDWGPLANQFDSQLEGLYDGQVAHVRVWNQRLKDGTTGFKDGVGKLINLDVSLKQASGSGSLGLSFTNFKSQSLTGVSASNVAAWWYFNNMNGITGADIAGGLSAQSSVVAMAADRTGNLSSNTGSVVGNGIVKLLDSRNLVNGASGNIITDLQVSGIPRDFLYFDQPQINNPVDSKNTQGRLVRKTIQDSIKRIGLVFYDLGVATIDGDDPNARLDFTFPASGATGDFGFAVTGHNNTAFNFQRIVYHSQIDRGRLLVDAVASGSEMNFSGNPSGVNPETGGSIFDEPATYITSIGLYNHQNDLVAIAKLSKPVRKDQAITLGGQVKLDF
tara:strand:+ start:489 stop:2870 length:2382 start_codon:yes stop_codon:yes gene_type:complete